MIVTIIGVDHQLQSSDPTGDFGRLLSKHLEETPTDLIAEEARINDCTLAKNIALERSIRWLSIDTTSEDRNRLGIPLS